MSRQSVTDDISPDEKSPQFLQDSSGFEEWATEIVKSVETRRRSSPVSRWALAAVDAAMPSRAAPSRRAETHAQSTTRPGSGKDSRGGPSRFGSIVFAWARFISRPRAAEVRKGSALAHTFHPRDRRHRLAGEPGGAGASRSDPETPNGSEGTR
jgi:hypothetical protein